MSVIKSEPAPARTRIRKRRARQADAPPSPIDDRLLAAVEKLLSEGHGFAGLSVARICTAAGIGRATFYLHYRDRAHMVENLMHRLTREVVDNAGSWFEGDQVDARSMQLALKGIVTTFRKHAAILSAVADTAPQDLAVAAAHRQMMDELCRMSRRAISRVRAQGNASRHADAGLADLLTLSIEAYCARHIQHRSDRQLDAYVRKISHICGRAIFADYPA